MSITNQYAPDVRSSLRKSVQTPMRNDLESRLPEGVFTSLTLGFDAPEEQ
jgi:hypothetical protein